MTESDKSPEIQSTCAHDGGAARVLFAARDYVSGDSFEIRECLLCHLCYTHPKIPLGSHSRYYPDSYYGVSDNKRFPLWVEWLQSRLYRKRVKALERRKASNGKRVLDVGCGRGDLLNAFKKAGWEGVGIELTESSARIARERFGLSVHADKDIHLAMAPASFDVIVLWHVLEHFPDPATLLTSLHRLLAPGGILFIGVPNFGSPEARRCRSAWFHLDVPRHLVHFSPDTLHHAIGSERYERVEWGWFAPEFDLFSLIQSAQNLIGLPHNLLYRSLRRDGAQLGEVKEGGLKIALAFLLAPLLALVGFPALLFCGFTQQGSSMWLMGRRRL